MKTNEWANYFKVPYLFQDIMYFMSGAVLLFILNFILKIDIKSISNYTEFNDFTKIIIFLSVAYFVGRIESILGNSLIEITKEVLFFIFIPKKRVYPEVKNKFNDFKLYILKIARIITPNNNIGHDIDCLVQNNEYLRNHYERSRYHAVFIRLLLGCIIILLVFIPSIKLFILTFIILFYAIFDLYHEQERRFELGKKVITDKVKT